MEDLARRYIESEGEYGDAWEEMDDLCRRHPMQAIGVISTIARALNYDPNARTIQCLAAGPLEDLLVRNGLATISKVEEIVQREPEFARLLGGVWRNDISAEVWARIEKIRGRIIW